MSVAAPERIVKPRKRVLVACEFSGIVREAFTKQGHDAWSCDLLPTEQPGQHIVGDVLDLLDGGWDLMVAHPPCTYLAVSGARWWAERQAEQLEALEFVKKLLRAPIPTIALENPVGAISSKFRKPDQIVEPYFFGHHETKATCLWLSNLPKLKATKLVTPSEYSSIHLRPPGPDRWKFRSRTYQGLADAMASQWG